MYFQHYWPFVRGIHWWPVDSLHKRAGSAELMFSFSVVQDWCFLCCLCEKLLNKQSSCKCFEMPGCSWVTAMACVHVNTLRPRQNGRHLPDEIFKCISLTENVWISIEISLKFVPKGPINNIPALVQIMAWRRPGDKPLSEPMMVNLPTHICVTQL